MLRDRCLSVCNVGVLWPNGWMDQDASWYGGRTRPRRHCVKWRPSSQPPKGTQQPALFGPCLFYCGQTAGWTKMTLGMEVGLGPGDFVFDEDPAPHQKKVHIPHPIFGPCLLCQTAGWIKMPCGTEANLGPDRRCVRWGRSSPPAP